MYKTDDGKKKDHRQVGQDTCCKPDVNCTQCSFGSVCCASSRHLGAEARDEGIGKGPALPPAISHYASIHYEHYLNSWPWPTTMGVQYTDAFEGSGLLLLSAALLAGAEHVVCI